MHLIGKNEITVEKYGGITDGFGEPCELWVSHAAEEYTLRKPYTKHVFRRIGEKSRKLEPVEIDGYKDVIAVTRETQRKLNLAFPEYTHPDWIEFKEVR